MPPTHHCTIRPRSYPSTDAMGTCSRVVKKPAQSIVHHQCSIRQSFTKTALETSDQTKVYSLGTRILWMGRSRKRSRRVLHFSTWTRRCIGRFGFEIIMDGRTVFLLHGRRTKNVELHNHHYWFIGWNTACASSDARDFFTSIWNGHVVKWCIFWRQSPGIVTAFQRIAQNVYSNDSWHD